MQGLVQKIKTQFANCDLLIYQAEADSHIHDPLGGLTDSQAVMQISEIKVV
ncbi:hypothetical protein [Limnohabitans sp. Rim8]|jgi:hypothetical protein|uniref:hypothetical protein n=1 Tax=Limnohabitans sp. Rim8 TaxID=1100718 RepID=UPI00260901AC|nr:hypothetical protein [Limnohabitans sp. Rim8]